MVGSAGFRGTPEGEGEQMALVTRLCRWTRHESSQREDFHLW
jgi:hypothetical protein